MAIEAEPGEAVRVTISRTVRRASARKTLERLFMQDKAFRRPIETREKNFKALPRRRGGRIWTKHPNKLHPSLEPGTTATVQATPQSLRDLNSVAEFITVGE